MTVKSAHIYQTELDLMRRILASVSFIKSESQA
jgi:hypothetical protein